MQCTASWIKELKKVFSQRTRPTALSPVSPKELLQKHKMFLIGEDILSSPKNIGASMTTKKAVALFFIFSIISSSFVSAKVFSDTGPLYDRTPRNALSEAAIAIGSPLHLNLIAAGLGDIAGATSSSLTPWGLLFTSPDKLTLDQARPIINKISTELLEKIYKDPSFANYSIEALKRYPKMNYPPVTNKSLAIRIDFWDENVDRPLHPYIAEIRLVEEKIYYYYADPKTQGLQEPFLVEPFSAPKSLSL